MGIKQRRSAAEGAVDSPETPLLEGHREQTGIEGTTSSSDSNNNATDTQPQSTAVPLRPLDTETLTIEEAPVDVLTPPRHPYVAFLLAQLDDERGTGWPVVVGLATLVLLGMFLGLITPKDASLPTAADRYVSASIGYTYFLCWSVSFYPQVLSNYRRKSTIGLSPDYCGLNVLGFGCYMIYNACMFWSPVIHKEYRQRYGDHAEISVQSNDVAFAVHAFCLAIITMAQIGHYNGFRGAHNPSRFIQYLVASILVVLLVFPFLVVFVEKIQWLDYLYLLSYVKILITLIKYVPQVILNYQRKSTVGWSIWNIILDFSGGILSDLQLVLDCSALGDWTGITGNLAKLGLGLFSVAFDMIFMLQHYVLYAEDNNNGGPPSSTADGDDDVNETQREPLLVIDDCTL